MTGPGERWENRRPPTPNPRALVQPTVSRFLRGATILGLGWAELLEIERRGVRERERIKLCHVVHPTSTIDKLLALIESHRTITLTHGLTHQSRCCVVHAIAQPPQPPHSCAINQSSLPSSPGWARQPKHRHSTTRFLTFPALTQSSLTDQQLHNDATKAHPSSLIRSFSIITASSLARSHNTQAFLHHKLSLMHQQHRHQHISRRDTTYDAGRQAGETNLAHSEVTRYQ